MTTMRQIATIPTTTSMQSASTIPILTPDTYFSHDAERYYMGSTQYKAFAHCETAALARLSGDFIEEPGAALLVGSYVDAYFSGTRGLFKSSHPEIFKRDGTLRAEYEQADEIIARASRDKSFMSAMSGKSQVIMFGEIEGVPVKIKVDSLLPDRTVDLKVMKDMADIWSEEECRRVPFWRAWRYDIQAAIYQEVRYQNEGVRKPFGLAVATKEKAIDLALLEFTQPILDAALEEVRANIVYFDALKKGMLEPEGCGSCAVCREMKALKGWQMIC